MLIAGGGGAADDAQVARPSCATLRPPRHGIPDGLPHEGETTLEHVRVVLGEATGELAVRFGAFDVGIEPRNGDVWSGHDWRDARVFAAHDFQFVAHLHRLADAPTMEWQIEGVPVHFVVPGCS